MIQSNSENNISATYAGKKILAAGQYIAAAEYGCSRTYTTTAEPTIGAEAPTLRAYGNAQGNIQLPVAIDFASEAEALFAIMEYTNHTDQNQTGTLNLTIGNFSKTWHAGIQSIDCSVSYSVANTVRLQIIYSFVLGEIVS